MTDLPIPFSPAMVRANLREVEHPGTGKTQTRRVLTKLRGLGKIRQFGPSDTPGYDWHFRDKAARWHDLTHEELLKALPYSTGDRLYVREHWTTGAHLDRVPPREISPTQSIGYIADEHEGPWLGRFRQGMHMPRWASRLTLIVTDVRVQRVQEISEDDAEAEGWPAPEDRAKTGIAEIKDAYPIGWFAHLWDSLNASRGFAWDANPWVAAYTFRVIKKNIDQIEREAA